MQKLSAVPKRGPQMAVSDSSFLCFFRHNLFLCYPKMTDLSTSEIMFLVSSFRSLVSFELCLTKENR